MKNFEDKILGDIRRHSLLQKGDKVLIALSGGPDSVCLAVVLSRLKGVLGISLAAGHVNYGLRGADSDKDEVFAGQLCDGLNIPFHSISADPRNNGTGNLEETARSKRYEFLSNIACRDKLIIATGHNSDDQAETFLLNLLRGAGYKGLSGMLPKRGHRDASGRNSTVIRPLLHVNRDQIIGYLENKQQEFRIDDSNADQEFDRNWIRHELLPLLGGRFNPRLGERIARASVLIGEAAQFLEAQAEAKLNEISGLSREGALHIPVQKILPLQEVLQREILRLAVSRIKGNLTDITSRHIFAVMDLLAGQSGRKTCLPGRIEIRKEFDFLVISIPAMPVPPFEYSLDIPGSIYIPQAGKQVTIKLNTGSSSAGSISGNHVQAVTIRNRRPGDRLKISAGRPRQSFSNLCTQHRIPGSERDRILILEFPDQSHWVEGIGMTEEIKTGGNTEITISVETDSDKLK
ncbi:MAG: tRNA lysidine(34) synthetase TilS [Acidobacteriota bacterium]